jgi:hypothetical protein
VHAWSEAVAAEIIGPTCAIHYVDGYTRRWDRTRTYDLWASGRQILVRSPSKLC